MEAIRFKKFMKNQKEDLYEFANLYQEDTGIQNIVIHAYSQGNTSISHGPRIKVSNIYGKFRESDSFVIEIKNNKVVEGIVKIKQKELDIIRLWIALNKKELLHYWKVGTEIRTQTFINSLKKIDEEIQ